MNQTISYKITIMDMIQGSIVVYLIDIDISL